MHIFARRVFPSFSTRLFRPYPALPTTTTAATWIPPSPPAIPTPTATVSDRCDHEEAMEARNALPPRTARRVIIHFDYDCFYASVFAAANPALHSLPFAVQQKQIIVTCNYAARARGLHKLQLVKDARRICPEVIVELGEDIGRFRDASKELYKFIEGFTWSGKVERLGFDEVWLDVTDVVGWNMEVLNRNDLEHSFFQLEKGDPEKGFLFDANAVAGHTYPAGQGERKKGKEGEGEGEGEEEGREVDDETLRLRLGSHLAMHIRHQLELQKGYTATVGIAGNKLLSKLVGNLHKPKDQTTLIPSSDPTEDHAQHFIDSHEIGKIPGIGFKLAQKLRAFALGRAADFDRGLVYGGTKEPVTVQTIRTHPDLSPEVLEKLLSGPGSPHGIGLKIWNLLHAVDETEVSQMRTVPRQISIEDSYIRLDTLPEVMRELETLATSLIGRMRKDLVTDDDDDDFETDHKVDAFEDGEVRGKVECKKKWLAHPRTLRLTTRPRQALLPDGMRPRSFKRISHSAPLPTFTFSLTDTIEHLAEKLAKETLVGMFRRLHPEKSGWNLSLVNLAVTNMAETGGESRTAGGRDIGGMFRRQEGVLKDFRVTEVDGEELKGEEDVVGEMPAVKDDDGAWDEEGEDDGDVCGDCGMRLPGFAMGAHRRFHSLDP